MNIPMSLKQSTYCFVSCSCGPCHFVRHEKVLLKLWQLSFDCFPVHLTVRHTYKAALSAQSFNLLQLTVLHTACSFHIQHAVLACEIMFVAVAGEMAWSSAHPPSTTSVLPVHCTACSGAGSLGGSRPAHRPDEGTGSRGC